MYFEHVIQVNDLNKPLLAVIPRDTLWRGLLRRAERPQDFLPDLAQGEIIERGDHDDLLRQKGKYYQLYTGQFELS